MPIINTIVRNSKFKIQNFLFFIIILIFGLCVLDLLSGCIQKSDLERAGEYARQAEAQYQRAAEEYKKLISKGKDLDKLYLRLGRLYYDHGNLKEAVDALKQSLDTQAKKFLAISYYRLGNFTDALEVFDKNDIADDEYLYYHGLTCEKLNLYDQALEIYAKIKGKKFSDIAGRHIEEIEKEEALGHIKDISPETDKILKSAPDARNYPQAGALILSCDERIEVSDKNTQEFSLHYLIKILNERGKEDFSETVIDYDSTYEKVQLEFARTIKPDGTVMEVGSRHIRDVSRYMTFPLYSNARAYIISFPEIVEGAIIEYKLKIFRSQLINKKDVVMPYPVQAGEPVLSAHFSVSLPKDRMINIKIINDRYNDFGANLTPHIEEGRGRRIYSWQFKDIPQIIPESNMPPAVEVNPTVILSTFNNWQEIYDWWWGLAKDKIKPDEAIKQKVAELVKDKASDEEKIRAIHNFCAQKIRYVAVEYGQAGYEPHRAELIFKNKYGDCKDQAILLVTMLRGAGIEAWPVLIATKQYYNLNPEFPSALFNHCIAAVRLEDKTVFVDPTAETCSFENLPAGDQNRRVLVFKEGYKIEETPLYPAAHNMVKQALNAKINSDETLSAERVVFTYGFYDQAQRYWLLYTQPELIREALKEKIQDVSIGAKLLKYDIENLDDLDSPVVLRYEFQGPEYLTNAGLLRIMPQSASLDTSIVAKDKRKYAIDFTVLDSKQNTFTGGIPDNFVVKYMPENVSRDSRWLSYELEYSFKDGVITFRQKSELKKAVVAPEEYPEFKRFFEGLARQVKQRIVLEKLR